MKNKKLGIIIIIIILGLLLIGTIINLIINKPIEEPIIRKNYKKGNFYIIETLPINENIADRIIVNKEELLNDFPEENIDQLDFDSYNYAIIEVELDSCLERDLMPKGYIIEDETLEINFTYEGSCGVCPPDTFYYLLELNKDIKASKIKASFDMTNNPNCDPTVAYKPIIYIYPSEQLDIEVKLSNKEKLLFTYPKYNNGWKVTVKPDGTITTNNKNYYALFWEGNNKNNSIKDEGFVIKGKDAESFLEEKLTILGLNDKERNEFIIFWLPKLEQNRYNYIYFESQEEINNYMSLDINPKPDNLIRIHMDYKPLQEKINVKEQILTTPERVGYTIVEWGGSIIK